MTITNDTKLKAAQQEFNSAFQFLKLEFDLSQSALQRRDASAVVNGYSFGDCRAGSSHDYSFDIMPGTTIAELKQFLKSAFGLNVLVLRKSGNVWLETTRTESWTLEEQNTQGEKLSTKPL